MGFAVRRIQKLLLVGCLASVSLLELLILIFPLQIPQAHAVKYGAGNYNANTYGSSVSILLTSDGTVTYGIVSANTSKSTIVSDLNDTQMVQNDSTMVENFSIKTTGATGVTPWNLGSSTGANTFVHEFSTNEGNSWTKFITADTYQSLASNVAESASEDFDLRITLPTSSSDYQQKTITVTVLAEAP